MKTIIRITKQEALNAWKEQNQHILQGEDTTVEIEENSRTFTYVPSMPTTNQCLVCGEYIGNAVHYCKGYKITC